MNNVISTRAKYFRNLKDFKFVPKLDKENAQTLENNVEQVLGKNYHKVIIGATQENILNYVVENDLISKNTKGIFLNKTKSVSVSLFEEEHVLIRATGYGFDKTAIQNAAEVANLLSNKISLAYSDEYGYLMSNLQYLGTGLKLECDIDLNALVSLGKIEQVKQNVKKLGFNLQEREPNIFTLSTLCNLGFAEKEIIEEFEKMVAKLQDLEIESAKMLEVSKHDEVMDKVMRSQAILSSCYLMSVDELKFHLSVLRTGANLNLTKIEPEKLIQIQKLTINKNTEIASQSELVNLAESVRKIIKGETNV